MINKIKEQFDMFRFKIVLKIILLFVFLVAMINVIGVAYSRYGSETNVETNAKIAYFITNQGTKNQSISLADLVPSDTPYLYKIYVYNYDEQYRRTNVDLSYKISLKTTTNLPLEIKLIRNETYSNTSKTIITNEEIIKDEDMIYKEYTVDKEYTFTHKSDQYDEYTLIVTYPKIYENMPDEYQGLIDLVDITIDAKQLV